MTPACKVDQPHSYVDIKIREAEEADDAAQADYWRHVGELVSCFPPLTDDEKVTLRAIFGGSRMASRAA